jgi:ABC-2 type transport system permease protein
MRSWGKQVFTLEFRKIMAYRADFWLNYVIQTFVQLVIAYALWTSIFDYNNVTSMNGYSLAAMIMYYLIAPAIFRSVRAEDIGFISREIYEGSLNKYIIYPISFFKYKLITYSAHFSLYFSKLLVIYAYFYFIDNSLDNLSLSNLALGVVSTLLAAALYFCITTIIECIAFWADNIWSLSVMMRMATQFLGGLYIPLSFFPEWGQTILAKTPFPFLAYYPVQTMMGKVTLTEWTEQLLGYLLWIGAFYLIARLVWSRGKYKYTGVGI